MSRPPNIVYILSDDLGYGDISCLNPDSRISTPCMDRLAAEGMVFTDAHSNSAVCTPTRYGILTGRYCWRSRLKKGVLWGYSPPLLEPGRPTLASMLQDRGYDTACIGKWHLGLGWAWGETGLLGDDALTRDPGIDFSAPLTEGPHTVGFAYSHILPASLDMPPYCHVRNGLVDEPPDAWVEGSSRPAAWRAGACSPGFRHEDCLPDFVREAEEFIAGQRSKAGDEPFFLYFAMPSPHTPHVPSEEFRGKSLAGPYGDYVAEHDWSIGRLLHALDRYGFRDNTLVVLTSDNGAHMKGAGFDIEREYGHRSNHIYRGQKSDCWDGGHRVPFFLRWPGRVAEGSSCDETICLTDFLATAADILETEIPEGSGEDSVSFLSLLLGGEAPSRGSVVHHSFEGYFALRKGPWKLIACGGSGGWSEPEEVESSPVQLYRMDLDPGERKNVAADHPEILEDLFSTLGAIQKAGGDEAGGPDRSS